MSVNSGKTVIVPIISRRNLRDLDQLSFNGGLISFSWQHTALQQTARTEQQFTETGVSDDLLCLQHHNVGGHGDFTALASSQYSSVERGKMDTIQNCSHRQLHKTGFCGLLVDTDCDNILGMAPKLMLLIASFDLPHTVIIPNRKDWILHNEKLLRANSCWFRDGSKTPSGSGVSVYCLGPRTEISTCLCSGSLHNRISGGDLCHYRVCEEIGGI